MISLGDKDLALSLLPSTSPGGPFSPLRIEPPPQGGLLLQPFSTTQPPWILLATPMASTRIYKQEILKPSSPVLCVHPIFPLLTEYSHLNV